MLTRIRAPSPRPSGRAPAASRRPSSACTSSASACSSASSSRTTSASAPAARSRPGIGLTAYTLGLRHAFDADHIAAIDNTTRKFMGEGQRPLSVGFFFSLGPLDGRLRARAALLVGVKALAGPVEDGGSTLHTVTGLIGTGVSGTFLYLIAALNLVVLVGIVRVFRDMRRGIYSEDRARGPAAVARAHEPLPRALHEGGPQALADVSAGHPVRPRLRHRHRGRAALPGRRRGRRGAAVVRDPLPARLFAAGMSLLDTIDGSFMNFAYGWAFSKPVRKVYHNITITGLSVAVALIIGTIELLSIAAEQLSLTAAPGVGGRDRPQRRGLHHRRPVRGHVGGGPRGLALRAHRGALGAAGIGARERVGRRPLKMSTPVAIWPLTRWNKGSLGRLSDNFRECWTAGAIARGGRSAFTTAGLGQASVLLPSPRLQEAMGTTVPAPAASVAIHGPISSRR